MFSRLPIDEALAMLALVRHEVQVPVLTDVHEVAEVARAAKIADRLQIPHLEYDEGVRDKVAIAQKVLDRVGAKWEQCVMVGDDLPDVALMKKVARPIAVANAQPEVKLLAKTVLGTHGGQGAVREMVEMVLRHNGTWEQVLKWYDV